MPITWRNVDAPSAAPAFRAMESAGEQVNAGLNIFNKVLQQRQAFVTGAENNAQEVSKQAYLDRLQSATTPEEVAALQASGELDGMTQGMRPDIRGQLRGAADARLTSTRQAVTAANAYDSGQADIREKPLLDSFMGRIATGGQAHVNLEEDINASGLRSKATLLSALATARQTGVTRERETENFNDANRNRDAAFEASQLAAQDAARERADAAESRRLEERLAATAMQNTARATELGRVQGQRANSLGLPVKKDGTPDYGNWSNEDRQTFDVFAKLSGFPNLEASVGGDTARGTELFTNLSQSGEFSPRTLAANEARIRSAFNSAAPGAVGDDAANQALADAQNAVGFEKDDANNWYAQGSSNARRAYADISKMVPEILKGKSGYLINEDDEIAAVQSLLGEVAATGIKRKDGTVVVPSTNDFMRFLQGSETGIVDDGDRAKQIRKKLTAWVNSPEGIDMARRGARSESYQDKQKVRQRFLENMNPQRK